MQIRFVRTGGFAGMRLSTDLNTDTLNSDESREVRALVDSSGFFDLPKTITPTSKGADQYSYSIIIEEGQKTHTVQFSETAMPSGLRPLINYLMEKRKSG